MKRQRQPGNSSILRVRTVAILAVGAAVLVGIAFASRPFWPDAWTMPLAWHEADHEEVDADHGVPLEEHGDGPHRDEVSGADPHAEEGDSHAAEDHVGGNEAATLEMSIQARRNIGLTLCTIQRRDFQRNVVVPAVLIERPGRSVITVSAPLTGIVTRIYPIPGEAVAPGTPLFELRLTHEDLVEKQSALLRDLEQLDVVKQEVERLKDVTKSGAVAGKTLLERVYEQQKVEGAIRAARQALLLHGLTETQIATVVEERRLIREIVVTVPEPDEMHALDRHEDYLQVDRLAVHRGDHVMTGSPLLTLTDHCLLFVEGQAFEHDAEDLNRAANENLPVSVLVQANGSGKQTIPDLQVLYVDNEVERDSRALKFYVPLPNEILRNEQTPDGHRFIAWRYRPGQRVEVLVPIERWKDRIVLPVEAVIQDGVESFVYQACGDHFDRKPVQVAYRDQQSVVIEDDGSLQPSDEVAVHGAYQIHLAIKNQSNAPDPHAGHQH